MQRRANKQGAAVKPVAPITPVETRTACRCRAFAFPHYHNLETRRRAAQKFNDDLRGVRRPLDVPDKDKATWPEEGW